jgi:hypothetical protein
MLWRSNYLDDRSIIDHQTLYTPGHQIYSSIFINDFTHCRFNYYKKCVKNNISLLHDKAVCAFPKFDLNFKIYYSKNIVFIN